MLIVSVLNLDKAGPKFSTYISILLIFQNEG